MGGFSNDKLTGRKEFSPEVFLPLPFEPNRAEE
jgi:hypothetical protein